MGTSRRRRRRRRQKQKRRNRILVVFMLLLVVTGGFFYWHYCYAPVNVEELQYPSYIQQMFIQKDGHSRTGKAMQRPKEIVIHYVGNPGSSAKANRDFFNSPTSRVSAHFTIGLQGEVIQCVPLDEESAASNNRNVDTISIEVCHPDQSGRFNPQSYGALIKLTTWLCTEFRLNQNDLIRHYDVTGKLCPKYYVEHPKAWKQFKKDVKKEL